MRVASARLLLGLCCALASGCAQQSAEPPMQERFFAMGTWVDVTLGPPIATSGDEAMREIEAILRAYERNFYPWTAGELATLNEALVEGRSATVSANLARLLARARSLSAASAGLFEPGVGGLVELWGFHTTTGAAQTPPSATAIAAALAASRGIATLVIDGNNVGSTSRGVKLDLGGIAKGAAVGEIIGLLESRGVTSALVNAGGDLMVIGRAGADRPWRVGIRHPRNDGLLAIVELADGEAVFTSGDYERYYEHGGQRFHHLLDPLTGRPVSHTQALTVIADDPTLADAAATALFVAGPDRWRDIAQRLQIDSVLRVDATGTVEMTPTMSTRITPADAEHDIIMGSRQE